MADSRLETSLHPVHDLALLPSACVPVIRLRTNERQTRVISQKQLARWASHASLSIPRFNQFSAWSLRCLAIVLKIAAIIGYIVTQRSTTDTAHPRGSNYVQNRAAFSIIKSHWFKFSFDSPLERHYLSACAYSAVRVGYAHR